MSKEYIEREAAKARLRMWITDCVLAGDNEEADCFRDCIDLLDSIPAADVAPVVHGRWQSYESSRYVGVDGKGNPKYRNIRIYYCSRCGHCSIIRTKGCPNCRAKMDKEETNDKKQPEEAPGE